MLMLRADSPIPETYVYGVEEPLAGPIVVFGGPQGRQISREWLGVNERSAASHRAYRQW